jgi:FtsP/CotA-like multicopper oxidase with cupredoxin domain
MLLDSTLSRRLLLQGAATALAGTGSFRLASAQSADVTVLRAEPGKIELRREGTPLVEQAPIWGFGGKSSGPTLRGTRGRAIKVRFENALSQEAALIWPGYRGPPAGGLPLIWTAPGASREMQLAPIDAGTFSYRCVLQKSSQLERLYGMVAIQDTKPSGADRDVDLVLDEWHSESPQSDRLAGPIFTANGVPTFDITARKNERLRLRIVNASARHAFVLEFVNHPVRVMAIDGQPAEPFLTRDNRVILAPGNTLDLFVDMALAVGDTASVIVPNDRGGVAVARFVYSGEPIRSAPLPDPDPLAANPLPQRIDLRNAQRVEMPLAERAPNASMFADWPATANAPLFKVKRGTPIMMSIPNAMTSTVSVSLHGHAARLLDKLDDGWKPFWLSTWMVDPKETVRIAFVADRIGKWPIECQPLMRAERFGAWFEVV